MLVRSFSLGLATATLLATTSLACPWAGGKYSVEFSPDYAMRVTVNSKCTSVQMVEIYGNTKATMPMVPKGKKWEAKGTDGTRLVFDAKGRSIRGSRGGASRNARAQRLN